MIFVVSVGGRAEASLLLFQQLAGRKAHCCCFSCWSGGSLIVVVSVGGRAEASLLLFQQLAGRKTHCCCFSSWPGGSLIAVVSAVGRAEGSLLLFQLLAGRKTHCCCFSSWPGGSLIGVVSDSFSLLLFLLFQLLVGRKRQPISEQGEDLECLAYLFKTCGRLLDSPKVNHPALVSMDSCLIH